MKDFNESIFLNGKQTTKLEIIKKLRDDWFKRTFIINYGLIHVVKQQDLPEEFSLSGTVTDIALFTENNLDGLDYLLYNLLSIGIAIGREVINNKSFLEWLNTLSKK